MSHFQWVKSQDNSQQRNGVKKFGFRDRRGTPILALPKGGEVVRDGWVHAKEPYRERSPMTFTFKLSRRLARLRGLPLAAALIVSMSCSGDGLNDPSTPDASPDPTAVTISPDSASVTINGTTQFEARTADGMSASRSPWFRRFQPFKVTVNPHTAVLPAGATQAFNASTSLAGMPLKAVLAWSATGGRVDNEGRFTAGNTAGRYLVIVRTALGASDTASVTVTSTSSLPGGQVDRVVLTPAKATVKAGSTLEFTAEAKAANDSSLGFSPQYSATGGSIAATGKYTAPASAGQYSVIATDPGSGKADTSSVTVTVDAPVLAAVVLTPGNTSVTTGATQQFSATGKASDGSAMSITPSYSATGGSISSSGRYTAGSTAGTYRVIASASGKADTSSVTVMEPPSAPTLNAVVLTPVSASLAANETVKFSAKGVMSDGSDTAISVTFTATGGSITSTGQYTAASTGNYKVIAKVNGGAMADTSTVTVHSSTPNPTPPPSSSSCADGGRVVNVGSVSELKSALSSAQPGDCISLDAGNYSIGETIITRDGTASNRITLTGPRQAVLNGYLVPRSDYWNYEGFTVTGGLWGIYSDPGSWNIFDNIEVHHTQQEGIHLHGASQHNVIRNSYVHNTGTVKPVYGECIYLGSGATGDNPADENQVLNNTLTDCGAEGVDVKEGTSNNLVQGNTIRNAGLGKSIGSDAGIAIRGSGARVLNNTVDGTPRYSIQVWPEVGWGKDNTLSGNKMSGIGAGYKCGIQVRSGYQGGTTITSDNTVPSGVSLSCN
jgi:hypothetical protein